jgi:hypothetical protein
MDQVGIGQPHFNVVRTIDCHSISSLYVPGRQLDGSTALLVELVVRVILLCVVEHHILLDLQDIGEALGALFDLAEDQSLYISGASVLQFLYLGVIFLGVGFFPLRLNAGRRFQTY